MSNKKLINYKGLGYKALQKDNRCKREKLSKTDCNWLKTNGYRNVGWSSVISLSDKIQSLQELAEWSLEDLFLEVDRIGEKYQEPEEIRAFQAEMAAEAEQISEIIDQIFPDNEPEVISFSHNCSPKKWQKSKKQKIYYTN
jgi:hypothetical protein